MGKNTINFPHTFFPIWSMGLFFAMGEYPIIDELGPGQQLNWTKQTFIYLSYLSIYSTGFYSPIWESSATLRNLGSTSATILDRSIFNSRVSFLFLWILLCINIVQNKINKQLCKASSELNSKEIESQHFGPIIN